MKTLFSKISETLNESNEMDFEDVLLELQIMGYKVKDLKGEDFYEAKNKTGINLKITDVGGGIVKIKTSRDSYSKTEEYTYTELIDDIATNS